MKIHNVPVHNIWPITMPFCTRHDSVTVVKSATCRCDRLRIFQTRALQICIDYRSRSKSRQWDERLAWRPFDRHFYIISSNLVEIPMCLFLPIISLEYSSLITTAYVEYSVSITYITHITMYSKSTSPHICGLQVI